VRKPQGRVAATSPPSRRSTTLLALLLLAGTGTADALLLASRSTEQGGRARRGWRRRERSGQRITRVSFRGREAIVVRREVKHASPWLRKKACSERRSRRVGLGHAASPLQCELAARPSGISVV
jgi:hypothetical protein